MKVIFVTRDGKSRLMKEKLADHLARAGKGYIQGRENFVDDSGVKVGDDLFSRASDESMLVSQVRPSVVADDDDDEPLVSEAVKQFAAEQGVDLEKVQGTGKNGRVKRADVQAYKTRMLSVGSEAQSYQTTDLAAE